MEELTFVDGDHIVVHVDIVDFLKFEAFVCLVALPVIIYENKASLIYL